MDLTGKVALVTGGGHRLGRAIVLRLAESGCDVMIHYHSAGDAAAETRLQAQQSSVRAELAQADLSRVEGVELLFAQLDQTFGGIDLLVNSAAVLEQVGLDQASEQDWRRTVGLNLKGAFFCLQQAARRMRTRGAGAIVNVSDTAGHRPWKRFPLHSISKAGLEMLTQTAAYALAPEIRVNAVVPGPTLKPPWMSEPRWEQITRRLPIQRAVPAADVAEAVVFLLRNGYVTGHTLRVDGGALL